MISVCLTTYNGERFIKKQLDSILSQLTPQDEVLVFDDRSNDSTISVIEDIKDPRIKIWINETNLGYTRNYERAISNANGDYIFLSDQDDIWLPNKVDVCLKFLQEYDFVVSNAKICDKDDNIIADSFYDIRKPYRSKIGNIIKFGYLGCCMAFRKELLSVMLPFPTNNKMALHDNWLFVVSQWFGKVAILDDTLIMYRRHLNNVSSGGMKKTTNLCFKIQYRLYLVYQLIKKRIKL